MVGAGRSTGGFERTNRGRGGLVITDIKMKTKMIIRTVLGYSIADWFLAQAFSYSFTDLQHWAQQSSPGLLMLLLQH